MAYPSECNANFISQQEVDELVNLYHSSEKKKKSTGPQIGYAQNELTDKIVDRLKEHYGDFEVFRIQFFDVSYPHVIHNDAEPNDKLVERAFLFPLWHNGESNPSFITFDQWYDKHPAKFFRDGPEPSSVVTNTPVYDYAGIENLIAEDFDKTLYEKYFTHMYPQWLNGLSIEKVFTWKPKDCIVFHRHRLHSASDFRKNNITRKIGLSIFTRKSST